jgi:hypothetical protein
VPACYGWRVADTVQTAAIAAAASVVAGLIAAYAGARQGDKTRAQQGRLAKQQHTFDEHLTTLTSQLERQAKEEERRLDADEALETLRAPLLQAADDLGHRINNIQNDCFLSYQKVANQRQETAVLGTVYRLARWFGTLELLYDRAEYSVLERQRNAGPESVLGILREIGKTFATDRYDRATSHFTSSKFMIWREEQRAMGEIARAANRQAVVGFATFAARATGADARWFATFIADLESGGADTSQRLKVVQSWLARLVRELDANKSYLDAKGREPEWMQKAPPDPPAIEEPREPAG